MRKKVMRLEPFSWLEIAKRDRPKLPHTSEWFNGTTAPTRPGWYERFFTDSAFIGNASMQWWDGEFWRTRPNGNTHWRQVGDYPAWRGLAKPHNYFAQFDNTYALAA